jgi:hypothetical protein
MIVLDQEDFFVVDPKFYGGFRCGRD